MSRPFLTACWTDVCLFTYAVPPALLEPRLPKGLTLDTRDGQAFVSLVAFNFVDTRVLGIPWPGYRNFPELNLRYYVREGERRGVVFIREFVPQRFTAWLARTIYNEPYLAAPLRHTVCDSGDLVTAETQLDFGGETHSLIMTGRKPILCPTFDCTEHFFKEHHWGFGLDHKGRTIRYEVRHPVWDVYRVESHRVELDWAKVYGSEWGVLHEQTPHSVVLAVGSEVAVWPKGRM
jgi:uncharacterized protein